MMGPRRGILITTGSTPMAMIMVIPMVMGTLTIITMTTITHMITPMG